MSTSKKLFNKNVLQKLSLIFATVILFVFFKGEYFPEEYNELIVSNSFANEAIVEEKVENREVLIDTISINLVEDVVIKEEDKNEKATSPLFPYISIDDDFIFSIPTNYVALTFDDGPSIYTKEIVDILLEYEVGATFFFVGEHVASFKEEAMYAHKSGMMIGNHSFSHTVLPRLSIEKQEMEIKTTNQYLEEVTGEPVRLFRPPYGSYNEKLRHVVRENDLKMVLWNRDTKDWQVKDSSLIVNYVVDTNSSGGIYLLHENALTIEALPNLIKYLKEEGLKIVMLK